MMLGAFLVLVLPVVLLGGWVLGVVAFLRLRGLEREVARMRAGLAPPEAAPPPPHAVPAEAAPAAPGPARGSVPEIASRPPAEVSEATESRGGELENLLTQRWGLWLGAVALLLAGVFLIRYAVENGLLGPAARCVAAASLGAALLGGAEWLRRGPPAGAAPAALAAGGTAVLFGAAYGAGVFYALLDPTTGFALMAAAALAGLLASLRFGPLTAAVGLAGAFATPALAEPDAGSLPDMFAYLLAVTGAALAVMRFTAWTWLGWAAAAADALWVLAAIPGRSVAEAWAPALFVPCAAALHLILLPTAALDHPVGRRLSWTPFAALGASGLLLEAAVGGGASRAGVLLLAPLAVWKGWAEPRLNRLPWLAALFFLLALLAWALPEWQPSGEPISIDGVVQAVLPGPWAPQEIAPLLLTATGVAGFLIVAGLVLESRAPRPLPWAALTAGVPVLTLLVTYAQVKRFQADASWALAAAAVAGGLTLAAWRARRQGALARAGVHAAGAAAALALGCAMVLHDYWLTLAVALFLPPLARIEAAAKLPPLRAVALAVAAVVLVRLLLNGSVLGYPFGATPVVNGLLLGYGVPALCFAVAARQFRRRGDDLMVAVLEGGAIAFGVALVGLEIRHWLGSGELGGPLALRELALQIGALAIEAGLLRRFARRPVPAGAGLLLGAAAFSGAVLLLPANPAFVPAEVGWLVLLAGYAAPGAMAALALAGEGVAWRRQALGGLALVEGLAVLGLGIRLAAHPDGIWLGGTPVYEGELWAWSGAWLLYGALLMALGIARNGRSLRLAALAVIGLVVVKVFLWDMAGLAGLWRVMSFLGLGLGLIALGAAYRRFVIPPPARPRG